MHIPQFFFAGLVGVALLTAQPFVALAFSDVSPNHPQYVAIFYVQDQGIVDGYRDGTYRPSATINRAEFIKIVMEATADLDLSDTSVAGLGLRDLEAGAWYVPYVRAAVERGVVSGYGDGTYRPANPINFAEAAKIVAKAFGLEARFQASPQDPWYRVHVEILGNQKAIPRSIKAFDHPLTRAEMAELIYRLHAGVMSLASTTYDELAEESAQDDTAQKAEVATAGAPVTMAEAEEIRVDVESSVESEVEMASEMASEIESAPTPAPEPVFAPTPVSVSASSVGGSTTNGISETAPASSMSAEETMEEASMGGESESVDEGQASIDDPVAPDPLVAADEAPSYFWDIIYDGYGTVNREPAEGVLYLSPMVSTSPGETHAALMRADTQLSGDFELRFRFITLRQLREGSAPNPWEVAWLAWGFEDIIQPPGPPDQQFTYLILKPNGIELGEALPDDGQNFLYTSSDRLFPVGEEYDVTIRVVDEEISVFMNGEQQFSFYDPSRRTLTSEGYFAFYAEDAEVRLLEVEATLL